MIYLERTVTIKKGSALIDEQIILYKGDGNVEIQFFLKNNPYKTKTGLTISYGQLVIKREAGSIFSNISKLYNNKVFFVITGDMIDELCECGDYDFQIRLFNEDQSSRASLPPIEAGITIKQPICEEGVNTAVVNKIKATSGESLDVFDAEGNYNKTIWIAGDLITDSKLNKIEDAIYEINENIPNDYVTDEELNAALKDIDVDLTGYASEQYVQDAIKDIELTPGPAGADGKDGKDGAPFTYDMFTKEQLESLRGPKGDTGEQGPKGDTPSLDGYATEQYVQDAIKDIDISGGDIDLTGYATEEYVDKALDKYATKDYVSFFVSDVLGDIESLLGEI